MGSSSSALSDTVETVPETASRVLPTAAVTQLDAAEKPSSKFVESESGSYCKDYGKDKVIFLTKEDWDKPLRDLPETLIKSLDEEDGPRGVILPNGDINWACPCLGNLSYGPCALPFREAFSCFHYSMSEMKGSDCLEQFHRMTECMAKYPTLYPKDDDDEESEEEDPFATIDKAEQQAQREQKISSAKTGSVPKLVTFWLGTVVLGFSWSWICLLC